MKTYDITGKTALVTGANRGIGKAITESLVKNGVRKVYAAVRDPLSLAHLTAEYGDKIIPLELDIRNNAQVKKAAQTAQDTHIVINNAGVLKSATALSENAIDTLGYELDVNVFGLIRMAQAFAPVLKKNGGGVFVQINSVASLKSFPQFTTYCASKAASYSITQALRSLFAEQGTTVVSVHPGPIKTRMAENAGLNDIAEPPELVADALITAFRTGAFHVFPDSFAKQMEQAYRNFAEIVVEADMSEDSTEHAVVS
ncbi:MAG: SDR family NAD(P)-dependent oxidoreductase [Candidatus Auribacter fodinae]|jgi:NAD(P)-dependent dehydrogenase (short-subunit alcohol dehydrogenase family)|uniref:SDR family NAD(P)-dependent oxidoreductase n=1 Tax=Candidatus Auribacter fodinae TaxID=2093366 RepID=A0A3A4QUZ5_9BACT|nr:MAG: SDR family NAD(P)-dependent oxidoreductase [Candidatus Auribacter fodinae]